MFDSHLWLVGKYLLNIKIILLINRSRWCGRLHDGCHPMAGYLPGAFAGKSSRRRVHHRHCGLHRLSRDDHMQFSGDSPVCLEEPEDVRRIPGEIAIGIFFSHSWT